MKRGTNEAYEAPRTRRTLVELEGGFMNASVVDKDPNTDNPVDAGDQEIEGNYDFTGTSPWE